MAVDGNWAVDEDEDKSDDEVEPVLKDLYRLYEDEDKSDDEVESVLKDMYWLYEDEDKSDDAAEPVLKDLYRLYEDEDKSDDEVGTVLKDLYRLYEDEDKSDDKVQPVLKDLYRLKSIREKLDMKIERSHKLIAEDKRSTFTQQPYVDTITHDPPALTNMMETNMTLQADKKRSCITNPAQPAHAQGSSREEIENLRQIIKEEFLKVHSKVDAIQATQLHQHQRKVPRILLCTSKDRSLQQKLVTKLVPGIKAYQLHLLCEQQGHEHMVQDFQGCEMNLEVDDRWKKFFPALQNGFRVLRPMLKVGAYFGVGLVIPDPQQLLEDVNASLVQFGETSVSCGSSGKEVASRDNIVDAIQKVESSAAEQWLVDFLKNKNILTEFGLQRAVYKISVGPNCMEGHVAWLCDTHLRKGLKAGYLERFPS